MINSIHNEIENKLDNFLQSKKYQTFCFMVRQALENEQ